MENAALKKRNIINEIKSFGNEVDFKSSYSRMKNIYEDFKNAGYAGKENDDLYNEFLNAKDSYHKRLNAYNENIKREKLNIIKEISNLDYSKESNEKLRILTSKYKEIGYCNRTIENELYQSFDSVKREYYKKGEKIISENISKKEALINKLRNITNEKMAYKFKEDVKNIREEWKTLGFAGDKNNYLKEEYSKYIDCYFKKSQEEFEEFKKRKELQNKAANKKREIILKIYQYLNIEDPEKYTNDIKELNNEFYSCGYASKEENQELSDEFNRLKGIYFENVNKSKNEKYRNRIDNLRDKISDLEQLISKKENNNSNLRSKIIYLDSDSKYYFENKSQYEEYIYENEEKISHYRQIIRAYEDKIFDYKSWIK